MTIDAILALISALAPLVPMPMIGILVPTLVAMVRDLEGTGLFDGSMIVELDTLGDEHRKAMVALVAELAKHP